MVSYCVMNEWEGLQMSWQWLWKRTFLSIKIVNNLLFLIYSHKIKLDEKAWFYMKIQYFNWGFNSHKCSLIIQLKSSVNINLYIITVLVYFDFISFIVHEIYLILYSFLTVFVHRRGAAQCLSSSQGQALKLELAEPVWRGCNDENTSSPLYRYHTAGMGVHQETQHHSHRNCFGALPAAS